LIDQINSSDKPIVLKSNNGYTALVNIAASTKYDINHENGKIKNGLQNIWDKVSSESPSQKIESLIMAQQIFTMNGITTTTNLNSDVETIKLLDSLSHEKVIQMRIHLYTDYQVLLNNPMILESLTSTNIILDGINLYIDGPISSEQALLKDTNFNRDNQIIEIIRLLIYCNNLTNNKQLLKKITDLSAIITDDQADDIDVINYNFWLKNLI
jgi:predicted amidohydrolase YtcJ